jgi:hypothetical protein
VLLVGAVRRRGLVREGMEDWKSGVELSLCALWASVVCALDMQQAQDGQAGVVRLAPPRCTPPSRRACDAERDRFSVIPPPFLYMFVFPISAFRGRVGPL